MAKPLKTPAGRAKVVRIGAYVVHPYRVAVPEMKAKTLALLTARIKQLGRPTGPILTDEKGRILDGRAQLRACLAAGVKPPTPVISDRAYEPATVVIDSVTLRTNYSRAERTLLAGRLAEPFAREARARQETGKRVRENFPKGKAVDLVADAVGGTNGKFVAEAQALLENPKDADVVALIDERKIWRWSHAMALAARSGERRTRAVHAIRGGDDPSLILKPPRKADDEWHTPKHIVAAIRAAFGGKIMCDPCSPIGGSHVRARHNYTKNNSGLDYSNPWYDYTFLNPPFSTAKKWVMRAIDESGAADPLAETKRIYVLLPVRPDSDHQAELFSVATDVLFLSGHVAFGKPAAGAKEPGRNSILIAGLKCSTSDLLDMGLEGIIVQGERKAFPAPDSVEEYYRWQKKQRADGTWPERWDEPVPAKEARDAKALLDSQASARDERVAKGRTAIRKARKPSDTN